jgi:hypothetical protein
VISWSCISYSPRCIYLNASDALQFKLSRFGRSSKANMRNLVMTVNAFALSHNQDSAVHAAYDAKMKYLNDIDPIPGELIRNYGKAAPRVITAMIDRAIQQGQTDEALKLDRVRRVVELEIAA